MEYKCYDCKQYKICLQKMHTQGVIEYDSDACKSIRENPKYSKQNRKKDKPNS